MKVAVFLAIIIAGVAVEATGEFNVSFFFIISFFFENFFFVGYSKFQTCECCAVLTRDSKVTF